MSIEFALKLSNIQKNLKAPKGQWNAFGKYKYRNCEDILEAVKPLLDGMILTLSDKMVDCGGRVYVEATATLSDGKNMQSVTASAREAVAKKGMDDSQITGTSSSYARKYALNGLFCIDDNKDADSMPPEENKPINPAIDLIVEASKSGDKEFIAREWSISISANWGALDSETIVRLNNIINGE